jgi:hypothetical protein
MVFPFRGVVSRVLLANELLPAEGAFPDKHDNTNNPVKAAEIP